MIKELDDKFKSPEDDSHNHDVPDHKENDQIGDHYHDKHHIDSKGNHDDIKDSDFDIINSIYTSKRNLIFRISLTGVFLALASCGSAFDMLGEKFFRLPINDVNLSIRYFDILIICLSIGSLGPLFSSLLAVVIPWFHLLMDSDHTAMAMLIDSFGYLLVVWVMWFSYYVVFRNSYIHKDPNRKKDLFKRWMPIVFFIPIVVIFYTIFTVLIIYVTDVYGEEDHEEVEHLVTHLKGIFFHEHEEGAEDIWDNFKSHYVSSTAIIFGFEILRFSLCYVFFAIIEPQIKKLNHRYR
ncbi:hypothetical protein SHELI_v1c02530 [Spiroplasma helicoides]|uniref:Transmembrane protein n=1 Tax=Spiroplasma helicoides TaxID=216938 RepID=A0A1B3SJW3_9MOLU|nr:ECF transporter S component [Spiroplasma helicoides]AOG60208.1 hypothetical protein SHELI_v1c02530 [Spiroplasma helicoides]